MPTIQLLTWELRTTISQCFMRETLFQEQTKHHYWLYPIFLNYIYKGEVLFIYLEPIMIAFGKP